MFTSTLAVHESKFEQYPDWLRAKPKAARAWLGMATVALGCLLGSSAAAQAPVPGQNINMVSGRQWPGGDPFLQRQNEPSIAVSSRNVLHLLAGANDYRTVDLPGLPDGAERGDAWLGVFKSFDGGQTWQSTLLPGYLQDLSPQGLASPLKGFSAASDPVVRPGTNGLFYYSGMAFNRGSNLGQVFVALFADMDNKENGDATQSADPIKYIRTATIDSGTSGQFLDKPWIIADIPRSGAGTCVLPTSPAQTVPAGNVYIVFSKFTGSQSTKIMFSRSLDCGATWSQPIKLSESNSINQGTQVAIDPVSGAVYVAWRRFATSSQSDAIVFAKSTDFGQTFTKGSEVATLIPFDQQTTSGSFRTSSLPSLAVSVDSSNTSRIHLAWAQRPVALGDAQIVISTSTNGAKWSTPAAVDTSPVTDEFGNTFSRGHQFMPELTFAAGKLVLLYYDLRLDHTLGSFHPNEPFQPDVSGKYYKEERAPQGELPAQPNAVFTPLVTDTGLTLRRHTVDLRVAQATPGPALTFASAAVSRYRFGTRGDESGTVTALQQLQLNPPNFPLFAQGMVPFFGDYIDIAGQTFLPPAVPGGAWTFNTAPALSAAFVASWTSNQDVRPPADGDWTHYTPVGGGASSIFDPTKTTPACVSGQEGMRNQNIYSSRITQGLLVASPQDSKPLSATLRRAFAVQVQNQTDLERAFRLQIVNQPVGGKASFIQFPEDAPALTTLDVAIPAESGVARPVFATSTNPTESIRIQVNEITGVGGTIVPGGLSSFLVLNADGTVPTLVNPDGAPSGSDISTIEIYNPNVSNPNITNPNVSNPNVSNPNVSNPNVSNPNVSNPNVSNPDIASPNVSNPNVSNPNVSNPNVSNPNVSNPNITNTSISDATYTATNVGNTSTSYRVKLVGQPPAGVQLQLILTKTTTTPIGLNCQLLDEQQSVLLANITNPLFEPATNLTDPNITDASNNNPTFALRPGETALITLRGVTDTTGMSQVVQQVAPVLVPHPSPQFAAPLFITIATLPSATVGQPYNVLLVAIGGKTPVTWSVFAGSLPNGLTLDPSAGTISGTPTTAGSSSFTIQVTDSSAPAGTATRDLSLTVQKVATTTAVTSSANPSGAGQAVTFTATVTGAPGTPTGSATFFDGASALGTVALTGGSASLTTSSLGAGSHSITAVYGGDGDFLGSTSAALIQGVSKAATATTLTSSANPASAGLAVTFTATVTSTFAGTPSGSVTFKDGAATLATVALSGGSASLTTSSLGAGSHSITAVYGGDAQFAGSTSNVLTQAVGYLFTGFLSPLATAGTLTNPTFSGSANLGSAVPIKWQLRNASGAFITSLSTTTSLQATLNPDCAGAPEGAVIQLYSPTTGATGGSTFRYDQKNNQFVFNWDTSTGVPTGKGCYSIVLQLNDGTPPKSTMIQLN